MATPFAGGDWHRRLSSAGCRRRRRACTAIDPYVYLNTVDRPPSTGRRRLFGGARTDRRHLIGVGKACHSNRIASGPIVDAMDTATYSPGSPGSTARRHGATLLARIRTSVLPRQPNLPPVRTPSRADAPTAGGGGDHGSTSGGGTTALPPAHPGGLRSMSRTHLLSVAGLLLATLGFWLYGLTANGYANSFYSAAVQAGSQSWEAFFYGSSDAANSITVDKPPASLWLMALSVRLFGLSSASILVPEVLLGVATVAVLYFAVRRYFGHAAGMLAGVVLALTPVATLMFRFNNPDALLALLMTLASWATLRAVEKASARWLMLVGVFLGLGFLTKTLQAFLILPVLALVYLLLAPTTLRARLLHSLAALAALVVTGGWWVAIVELVPASMRPYIGGSQDNSFLQLTFGYNGLGRINGDETGSVGPNMGTASIWRMFSASIGGQISWFIPSALVFLVVGLWLTRRAPRPDPVRASYLVWGGGFVVTAVVFSLMAGIFHEYYTVALAPTIAAVIGIGAVEAWRRQAAREHLGARWGSITLALAVALATTWGFVLLTRVEAYGPLRYFVLALGMASALLLLVVSRLHARAVPLVAAAALVASLAGPAAYSITTVNTPASGSIVTAGPDSGMGGMGGMGGGMPGGAGGTTGSMTPPGATQQGGGTTGTGGAAGGTGGLLNATTPDAAVVTAMQTDASQYRWVAAAIGSQNAAGLQLGSGEPVMAIGGFNGSDPSPTLAQFQAYVAAGDIHYFVAGGAMGGAAQNGGSSSSSEISTWVQANFATVTIGGSTFYDLTQPVSSTTAQN